jgi:hypothetical protein
MLKKCACINFGDPAAGYTELKFWSFFADDILYSTNSPNFMQNFKKIEVSLNAPSFMLENESHEYDSIFVFIFKFCKLPEKNFCSKKFFKIFLVVENFFFNYSDAI